MTDRSLFCQRGIRAVGMDTVVKECGVGNATIYRQFPTKDALATAYLRGRADAWFERMRQAAEAYPDARDQLVAVFGVLAGDTAGAAYGKRALSLARRLVNDACPRS